MRAWIVSVNSDGTEELARGITNEYKSEKTLLRYGLPKVGRWNLHVHRNWETRYYKADKIISVLDGQII